MSELKLAISNIAWDKADDEAVYAAMQQNGFTGLEIAPTRIFPEYPYENLTGAALFGGYLLNRWGFHVPSMQSIWYGQTGNIFDPVQAEELLDYTAEAFQFAHTINCPSLVFGCPKNRRLDPPHTAAEGDAFFAKAGALASHYDVVLAIEANPPVYTNYLNNTADAFAMVKRLQSPGLAVNLDLSTMISNGERLRDFVGFQVTSRLMEGAKPDAMLLHCLPAHRGEEISTAVFEEHADEIFDEAENRLHAQKAVMVKLMEKPPLF